MITPAEKHDRYDAACFSANDHGAALATIRRMLDQSCWALTSAASAQIIRIGVGAENVELTW